MSIKKQKQKTKMCLISKKNQTIETDPEMTQMVRLTDRDIKTANINVHNMLKDLKKKNVHNKKRNRRYKKEV